MLPVPLRVLHGHAEPAGGAAAGGRVPAVGQVRHAGGARVLRAVTCQHTQGLQTSPAPIPASTGQGSFTAALLLLHNEV